MDKFIITPEDCLILKAINETKSLREAAIALDCDPAGLARKVQQISSQYGFVQKVNNRWQVNSKGRDLIIWAEDSIREQKKILTARNSLNMATTMWFAEELLISKLPRLKEILQKDTNLNMTVPNAGFEESLVNGSADFVIVCHPPENPEIEHKQITEEKWCLVMPASWNEKNILEKLKTKPFIRHTGINQDLFLPEFADGILNSGYTFDNLIGVKSAVVAGLGWSIVPKILVQRNIENKQLKEIPYELSMKDRKVCVWWLRNRIEMKKRSAKICQWVKESAE